MKSAENETNRVSLISLLFRQLQARLQLPAGLLIVTVVLLVGVTALIGFASWSAEGQLPAILRLTIFLAFGGGLLVGYCRLPQLRLPLSIMKRSDWLWTVLAGWLGLTLLAAFALAGPAIGRANPDAPGPWLVVLLVSWASIVAAGAILGAGLATIIRSIWHNLWLRAATFLGTVFGAAIIINGQFLSPILTAFTPETSNQLFLVLLWGIGSLGVALSITDQALASRQTVAERVGDFWFLRLSRRSFDQVASPFMASLLTEWLRIGRDRHVALRLAACTAIFFYLLETITAPAFIGPLLGLLIVTLSYTLAYGSPVTSGSPRLPYRHQFALSRALSRFLLASVIVLSLAISFAAPLRLQPVSLLAIGFLTACVSVVFTFANLVDRELGRHGRETSELVALLAALLVTVLFVVGWPLLSTSAIIVVLLAWTSVILWAYQRYATHQLGLGRLTG